MKSLKKTSQLWGIAGCDPFSSKGRGEPFERIKKISVELVFYNWDEK